VARPKQKKTASKMIGVDPRLPHRPLVADMFCQIRGRVRHCLPRSFDSLPPSKKFEIAKNTCQHNAGSCRKRFLQVFRTSTAVLRLRCRENRPTTRNLEFRGGRRRKAVLCACGGQSREAASSSSAPGGKRRFDSFFPTLQNPNCVFQLIKKQYPATPRRWS